MHGHLSLHGFIPAVPCNRADTEDPYFSERQPWQRFGCAGRPAYSVPANKQKWWGRERRNASVVLQIFVCIIFKDIVHPKMNSYAVIFTRSTLKNLNASAKANIFSVVWLQKTSIIVLESHGLLYRAGNMP